MLAGKTTSQPSYHYTPRV